MLSPDRETLKDQVLSTLQSRYGYSPEEATDNQMYGAVLSAVQNILLKKRGEYLKSDGYKGKKRVYYLSMEFLLGPSLKNHLYNLGLTEEMEGILKEWGFDLSSICKMEPDAGLGNGGLGRLAACYLDAATTLELPMTGFSIRYEFGIFKQRIVDGWQLEFPDDWLEKGSFWLYR